MGIMRYEKNQLLKPVRLVGVIAAIALVLAACAGDDPNGSADTTTLMVTGTDSLRFEPDQFTVFAGETMTVVFSAEESINHTFTIEGGAQGEELPVAEAAAGETVTETFTIDEAGSFEVFCSVPGHREAGMVATLTVVEDG